MLGGATGAVAATQTSTTPTTPTAHSCHGGHQGHGKFLKGAGRRDAVVFKYLGITRKVLRADRKAGESLATIANSTPGKSAAGLKAAIIAADTTRLNAAVASGKITSAQEAHRLAEISGHIDKRLDRTLTSGQNVAWVREDHKAWAHGAHAHHTR
jgi:hypothetical protein